MYSKDNRDEAAQLLTELELRNLPLSSWMPSRIPLQDALVAFVPQGAIAPNPPRPVHETRWFPEPNGARLLIPYDGGPFDGQIFHLERGAWDHVTCALCNSRIPAITLCHVTTTGEFNALCEDCFSKHFERSAP